MEIRKAFEEDFESVYPLLLGFNDNKMTKEDWRELFKNKFTNDFNYFGYYVYADSQAVGFFGLIFSERQINGKEYKFANMTSWIVKPEYRSYSLLLLKEILSINKAVLTALTTNANLCSIYNRLGFTIVDNYFLITPPLLSFRQLSGIKLIDNIDRIYELVTESERKLIDDHRKLKCRPVVFLKDNKYCLIFSNRIFKKNYPFSQVLYVSDRKFFTKYIRQISTSICIMQRTLSLYTGEHFTISRPGLSYKFNRKTFFKGSLPENEYLDFLYSELC